MPISQNSIYGYELKKRIACLLNGLDDFIEIKEAIMNIDHDWRDKPYWNYRDRSFLENTREYYGSWYTVRFYIQHKEEKEPMDHAGIAALEKEFTSLSSDIDRMQEKADAHRAELAKMNDKINSMTEERFQISETIKYLKQNYNARFNK